MAAEPASRNHFFIGGEWVPPSSDRRVQLIDASTEEALGSASIRGMTCVTASRSAHLRTQRTLRRTIAEQFAQMMRT